jgi:subtilisin-like proprotein convertase family protein
VNVTHTWDADLRMTLRSPGGTVVPLVTNRGGSGDNFNDTVFDDEAATPISAGTAPFAGAFRPESPLAVFDATPSAGTWTLNVADNAPADTGTLNSWGITMPGSRTCSTPPPPGTAPSATTKAASSIQARSATLNGAVKANGLATQYRFQYGTTTSYGSQTSWADGGSGTTAVTRSEAISGLEPSTTYHYRIVAQNSAGTTNGADMTFTTKAAAPIVITSPATNLLFNGATLNGTVNANGLATQYRFQYGTSTTYSNATPWTDGGAGLTAIARSAAVTGLSPSTTYHFRILAKNSAGVVGGVDRTFTTPAPAPTVKTQAAASVTSTSATLRSAVNPNGLATTCRFQYGTTTSYGLATPSVGVGSGTTNVSCPATVTGLTPNTTYHFRGRATNSAGTGNGADLTFTTLP